MGSLTSLTWRKQGKLRAVKIERSSIEDEKMENTLKDFKGEEPLSPSARMFHQPNFNVHVIAIMASTTPIDPDIIKQKLVHTLLKHPRFVSLQVEDKKDGTMKWVPTKVDLNQHVIIPNIDWKMENGDKFVEDYIYNLSKTTLDKSKPLWDLHLLNIKTSNAEALGIFRIHHSLGDGTSLMSLLLACTRQVSHPEKVPTTIPPQKIDQVVAKNVDNFGVLGFWRFFVSTWMFVRMMWNSIVDVLMFILTSMFLRDTDTPIKGMPGSEFNPRRIVFRTVSLDYFKLIKNAMNLTINDVALGITQAGLSRYLNGRYGGQENATLELMDRKNNLPKSVRLRSTLLINIRPSGGIQDLADMMEKDTEAKWGNWIGFVLLPFTIALRDDPLDYVREAKATIDRKKNSLEAIYTFTIADIVLKLFGIKAASALSHRIIKNTTMCFSNMVGPFEEIGFCGYPMAYIAPSSYGQPHALMINFQSYNNKMTIVVSVDESAIHDPYQLLDEIEDSLKHIRETVIARGLGKDEIRQQEVAFT